VVVIVVVVLVVVIEVVVVVVGADVGAGVGAKVVLLRLLRRLRLLVGSAVVAGVGASVVVGADVGADVVVLRLRRRIALRLPGGGAVPGARHHKTLNQKQLPFFLTPSSSSKEQASFFFFPKQALTEGFRDLTTSINLRTSWVSSGTESSIEAIRFSNSGSSIACSALTDFDEVSMHSGSTASVKGNRHVSLNMQHGTAKGTVQMVL